MRKIVQFVGVIGAVLLLIILLQGRVVSEMWAAGTAVSTSPDNVWTDVSTQTLRVAGEQSIQPNKYHTLTLNSAALANILAAAPLEFTDEAAQFPVELTLPLPDGEYGRFRIVESPIMESELAAKYPAIRTYAGQGLDDPTATVRFDVTPLGFHAQILSGNGRVFIDPLTNQTTTYYMSYFTHDHTPIRPPFHEIVEESGHSATPLAQPTGSSTTQQLRTYRLAMAATGEYTQHFGSKSNALAQIVTSLNRVNGIYINDLAVKLQLVGNNDFIVFEDPNADEYFGNYLSENQAVLDDVIGTENYDVGHVLTTSSGGLAILGVVCRDGSKARGTTGLPNPVGDPFDVDFLAHELGHQFGANHTFNSSCGGHRVGATAYEPGSGSTIMGYAGVCGSQNLQPHSDPYFHAGSIIEINNYLAGESCHSVSGSNNIPTVEAGSSYTIPKDTPFTLIGVGTDADNNETLTYAWEQFDLGPGGNLDNPNATSSPIFRSFNPTTSPSRTFPQISDILNNTQTKGEVLPNVARTMRFKLTVRDNQAIGGVAMDEMLVTIEDTAGPFAVTSWNSPTILLTGTPATITWDVANTNLSPVDCSHVLITPSADGGYTFLDELVTEKPNSGSATISIPPLNSSAVRFKVRCKDNIFFDINDANLTITGVETTYLPLVFR